jgi:hypothetical protein
VCVCPLRPVTDIESLVIRSFHKLLGSELRLSPLGTSATIWPIEPTRDDG